MEKLHKRPTIIPIKESIEDIIGNKGNYRLLKEYYRIMFQFMSQAEKHEQLNKKFSDFDRETILDILDKFTKYDIRVTGFNDGQLILISPAKGNVMMKIEKEYPLKEEYSKEELLTLKTLGRAEQPISKWPAYLFDKEEIPF